MNQLVKNSHSLKWKKNRLNKTRQRQMRVDNKIHWNLFQSLFAETAQCFQMCGQQTT